MNGTSSTENGKKQPQESNPWSPRRRYIAQTKEVMIGDKSVPIETVDGRKLYFRTPEGTCLSLCERNWSKIQRYL